MTDRFRYAVAGQDEPGWNYGLWRSVFFPVEEALGARYGVYNQRIVPLLFEGRSRFEGYWALRRAAGLFDVSGERAIEIAGPGAETLLNRLLTRDIARLKPMRATYGLFCYPDGGLICDGILIRLAADRFWYVQASAEFFPWLAAHAIGLDVAVRDPDISVLQVQGPNAMAVLDAACEGGAPEPFGYFAAARARIGGQEVLLTRTGWTGELGFEIYVALDAIDGPKLWRDVCAAGRPFGLLECALDAMDIRRIEAGILNYGSDMDATMTPFEAGLGRYVDLAKSDFVGKDALLARRGASRLYGLRCRDGEPRIGGTVVLESGGAGRVTAAAFSPYLDCGTALVRLDRPPASAAMPLTLESRAGNRVPGQLLALPFYDPEARIARGLDRTIPDLKPTRLI